MLRGLALAACLSLIDTGGVMAGDGPLFDGFDGPGFSPGGGLYYKENYEQSAGIVEFQNAVTHNGGGALKLTIEPLCTPTDDGCSERAEIWEKPALRVHYDQGVWYGFAVKFSDPVPQDDHRYLIAQWKREIDPGTQGDFSPFLALRLNKGKLFATVETNYHPASAGTAGIVPGTPGNCGTPVWLRPDTNQMRALVATPADWTLGDGSLFANCTDQISIIDHGNKMPSPQSGWIDFAIFTQPGPDGSGHIEIFANGKWIVTVKGHIGHADKGLGKNQYFKFGPYRSGHSTVWTMYYDDFRRSLRCADVLRNAPCPF
jgi:hypothetical protein